MKNKAENKDENEIDDKDPVLSNPSLIIDWVNENLTWEDISASILASAMFDPFR